MKKPDLFDGKLKEELRRKAPLADRMRPKNMEEFLGQRHILSEDSALRQAILAGKVSSLILWGPPGSGKTSLAHVIAHHTKSHFISFSAVLSGVKEIKRVLKEAEDQMKYFGRKTILFVDEIHRFNRVQQDVFLGPIEKGILILIGATTENPSFSLCSPLLSRVKVVLLNPLQEEDIMELLRRGLTDRERGLGLPSSVIGEEELLYISRFAQGDARKALNVLEELAEILIFKEGKTSITMEAIQKVLQRKELLYDKSGEEHYNLISAFIKSLRGSDPDGALYWLARMLEAGEDPLFILRRMVIFASEDIGNADPMALGLAIAAKDAYEFIGMPEGFLPLSQATIYLATAKKSNASYRAYLKAQNDVKTLGYLPVPLHLRNAPTKLMEEEGYGKGYKYPHDFEGNIVEQEYLPSKLIGQTYYSPTENGYEKIIKERIEQWRRSREVKKPLPQ